MRKLKIYFIITVILTTIINFAMGTEGYLLWIIAYVSLFNLFLTTKRSKWFIVPDLIWVLGMGYIAITQMLYYDLVQYCYYFVIAFIQFYSWSKHEDTTQQVTKIKHVTKKQVKYGLIALFICVVLMTNLGIIVHDANPFLDSLNTSLAFTGAYLLAKRFYEAQYLFLASNIFTAILYYLRGIPSVSLTMVLFSGFTIFALVQWRKGVE